MAGVAFEPAAWTPPAPPPLEGPYARNTRLSRATLWATPGVGPEDVVVDARGRVVTGLASGEILAFPGAHGGEPTVLANTGGRPLGIEREPDGGGLVVCDAHKGLLRLDASGRLETLVDSYEGEPLRFTNNAAIASDGTIYFSDTSTKYSIEGYRRDLLEHQPRGRLFAYDPRSRETRLVLGGLYFANGVALSRDERFVVVAQTGSYDLKRVWLKGPRAGETDVFVENLHGFPDNVSSGGAGVFWVALPAPRNRLLDVLLPRPRWRSLVAALPEALQPKPPRYGFVLGFDEEGRVVQNLQDPSGHVAHLTGAREHDGRLFVGSLQDSAVAVIELA
ncbi:MAG TPA: SMP-30/gluconolactonase/LRE family protein [Polyangiaceae bacterium]|nr:SMP-30/gluconolactonase/LRE family protein [Polyangiaceae bacterium]